MHDADFEMKFYEGLLQKKPDFVEALVELGELYTKKGMYEEGLAVDERLAKLKPADPIVFYNLACSYSLVKNTEEALKTIKRAIDCGYNDFSFLSKDDDLTNLRSDEKFKKYFSKLLNKKITANPT
jgi:tetratricopeptide (TPR) repeat protein